MKNANNVCRAGVGLEPTRGIVCHCVPNRPLMGVTIRRGFSRLEGALRGVGRCAGTSRAR